MFKNGDIPEFSQPAACAIMRLCEKSYSESRGRAEGLFWLSVNARIMRDFDEETLGALYRLARHPTWRNDTVRRSPDFQLSFDTNFAVTIVLFCVVFTSSKSSIFGHFFLLFWTLFYTLLAPDWYWKHFSVFFPAVAFLIVMQLYRVNFRETQPLFRWKKCSQKLE